MSAKSHALTPQEFDLEYVNSSYKASKSLAGVLIWQAQLCGIAFKSCFVKLYSAVDESKKPPQPLQSVTTLKV